MRLPIISILLLFSLLPAFAQSGAKTITIQRSKIRVEELLKEITKQSGLQFSYNPRAVDGKQRIAYRVRGASLEEALQELAKSIPIEYDIIENQIVLTRRAEPIGLEAPPLPSGPEYYTLSGFIADGSTGESLVGATVFARNAGAGASANEFGFYSLRLPKGNHTLEYSYLGFEPQSAEVELKKDEKKDVGLQNLPVKLPSIVVEIPMVEMLERKQAGRLEIKPVQLGEMPEFAGESGLIRGLQAWPGVKTHSDGSAFFFVRGGERDQNLIIIDDAPIYNPAHLFGFYSLVVPDFTKDIKVHKSDVPVSMGDRLSSIVDVRTKDGNLNKWEFGGAFNPLVSRLSLEGPVKKGKSSVFTSLRLSNFDWIYRRAAPDAKLGFGDFSFKWNSRINDNNRLFFTLLTSRDEFTVPDASVTWGNFAMTLRWNLIYNPRFFSNTIFYTGNYQYQLASGSNAWTSGIGKFGFKSDYTWFNNDRLTTKFGFEIHGYYFNPGKITSGELVTLFPTIQQDYSRQLVAYYQHEYQLSDKWRLQAGLRNSVWTNLGPAKYFTFDENYQVADTIETGPGPYKRYFRPDPRISLQYGASASSSFKLSYGVYSQFMQLISNSTSPFSSFEVWLPASANIRPQRAQQAALGYVKYWPKQGLEFSAEAYYKRMNNQIDYKPQAQTLLNPLIEGELRFGRLNAYGLELLLRKEQGRLNGWVGYTWSRAMRRTEGVNDGREYPAFQDRPHDFSIMLNYSLTRRAQFSAYWTAFTGSPFSSPTGFFNFNDYTLPIYGEKNNDRLPNYRRLDLAMKLILNKNPEGRFQHSLTFSIYNALLHRNIVSVNFNKVEREIGAPIVRADLLAERGLAATQTDLIRFFPSVTYKFKI
jgi:hypothetical protein